MPVDLLEIDQRALATIVAVIQRHTTVFGRSAAGLADFSLAMHG
jgi:hypothetical protein